MAFVVALFVAAGGGYVDGVKSDEFEIAAAGVAAENDRVYDVRSLSFWKMQRS